MPLYMSPVREAALQLSVLLGGVAAGQEARFGADAAGHVVSTMQRQFCEPVGPCAWLCCELCTAVVFCCFLVLQVLRPSTRLAA
jgi:hypothetical protein